MKILFLDIDGVLNHRSFFPAAAGDDMLDPACIRRLNRVTNATGTSIVVSSAWRLVFPFFELTQKLKGAGVTAPIIGRTPSIWKDEWEDPSSCRRGHEIQAWLDRKKHVMISSFAIVDDDADMAHLLDRLVKTDNATGLQDEHADRLISLLGRIRP